MAHIIVLRTLMEVDKSLDHLRACKFNVIKYNILLSKQSSIKCNMSSFESVIFQLKTRVVMKLRESCVNLWQNTRAIQLSIHSHGTGDLNQY